MKRINLRLSVTEAERDTIRKAAALTNHRSMAAFCRSVVLAAADREVRNVATSVANTDQDTADTAS